MRSLTAYLLVGIFSISVGCADRAAPPPAEDPVDRPDQESWDVSFFIEVDGHQRAHLRAPYVARFEHTDSSFARFGPSPERADRTFVQVFDDDGFPSAIVESDRLVYYEQTRTFVATGNVVVVSENDRRLEGERLTWHEAASELRSDGFVRITTPTERIQGYGLVADEGLDTYRLARVTGQIEVEDE